MTRAIQQEDGDEDHSGDGVGTRGMTVHLAH